MKKNFTISKSKPYEERQAESEREYQSLRRKGWRPKSRRAQKQLRLRRKRRSWQMFESDITLFFKDALKFPFVEHGKHYGRSQVDIAAGIDDILLIIDCKTKEEPGHKNLHSYITAHSGKRGTIKRNIRQRFGNKYKTIKFILALKEIDYSDDDVEYAKQSGVFLWGEKYIEILFELYKILGPESRYYFLKELDVKRIPIRTEGKGKYFETPALLLKNHDVKIYTFFLEAKKLLKLAYVARIESGKKEFYQRLVSKSRLNEIAGFIEDEGTFKNSIIVALERRPQMTKLVRSAKTKGSNGVDVVRLRLRKDYLSLWIIDGQHRLYGYTRVDDPFTETLLPVVAIEDNGNTDAQANTFIEINHKQKPVDSSLLWGLFSRLRVGEEEGAIATIVTNLAEKGVFHGKIYVPGVSKRRRKSYGIFFANFCKGILDRNLIKLDHDGSLYRSLGKDGYASPKGVLKVTREISAFFSFVVSIAKSARKEKWVKDFILTNNGLNIFLRVMSHYLHYSKGKINRVQMKKILRAPLKNYLIEQADSIDFMRRKASSEGTREDYSFDIIKAIHGHNSSLAFAEEYILRKEKNLKQTDLYKAYASLEKNLRKFVQKKLSKVGSNWWNARIPDSVRLQAEAAHARGEKKNPFIAAAKREPIDCLDFMDYPMIFERRDNWREFFQPVFEEIEWVKAEFKKIRPIRVKIAHPATMSFDEKVTFLKFCADMERLIS